jgi:acetylornithine deacetylase
LTPERQAAPGHSDSRDIRAVARTDNILTRVDGDVPPEQGGPLVLFDAHQDTVPVDGMTIDPFRPTIDGGRLYGRGACDVKGGMAAMIAALARLARERPPGRPTVVLACPVNEENGFTGARGVVDRWRSGASTLLPRAPDAAVIAEPTGLDVVVGHKGVVRWRCHALGHAAHSARPEGGQNAIYRMGHVLRAIERYAATEVARVASHPRVGPATVSVGVIHGGLSVNTVPDRCTIEIDRRVPPGEQPEDAREHLIRFLDTQAELDFPVEHDRPYMQGLPLSDADNQPLAQRVAEHSRAVGGAGEMRYVAYGTDAGIYSAAGVPAVVVGPGAIEQAHTRDEWIDLDQLERAAEIYYRLSARW